MTDARVATPLLLALLNGATFANATRRSGEPCRIRLPDDPESRTAIVDAHLRGAPSTLTFHANGHTPWREQVDAVALAAFCPAADGRCRWIGIDVDAADHGERGLLDPVRASRTLAERASAAGLATGLLVARSRRGQGRHVFLMLPEPATLADAVIGVAALGAAAFKVAASDVAEYGAQHAFCRADGAIARLGEAGAVELLPRSTVKPPHGWALAMPGAGAFAAHGGGVIVDPFEDRPIHHECVPRCDGQAWRCFVTENRHVLDRIQRRHGGRHPRCIDPPQRQRLHPLTAEFLAGQTPTGRRNTAAFAAACNLLGNGLHLHEVECQILQGARGCELPEREAHSAIQSALRAVEQSQ